jgi:hypothetical protein
MINSFWLHVCTRSFVHSNDSNVRWAQNLASRNLAVELGGVPRGRMQSAAHAIDYASTASLNDNELQSSIVNSSNTALNFGQQVELEDEALAELHLLSRHGYFKPFQDWPLWKETPDWWSGELSKFKGLLQSGRFLNNAWSIWFDWFDPLVQGRPAFGLKSYELSRFIEHSIAIGSRMGSFNEGFWYRKEKEINAEITKWVIEARATEVLEDAELVGAGLTWFATASQYQLSIGGELIDEQVASLSETAFEHEKLKARLALLSKKATEISSRRGWEELRSVCDELTSAISIPTTELHSKILSIYDASLMLASLLQYNNNLLADRGSNEFRPLQADESKLLQQVVMTVAPWIGRFPTAKRKDDEAGQMFARMSEASIAAHVEFAQVAKDAGLITEQDRKMMQNLLKVLQKFGNGSSVPAEKAQAHGQGTVRKLMYAMALVVSGVVGGKLTEDVVSETQTYKVTKELLLREMLRVEKMALELPPHLRTAFETVMNKLKRENLPDGQGPKQFADVPRRRRPLPRQ